MPTKLVYKILRYIERNVNKCKITYIPPGKEDKEDVSGSTMSKNEHNT